MQGLGGEGVVVELVVTAYCWRHPSETDLDAVAGIAAAAFPDHPEDPACFANRLAMSPEWCFGLVDQAGMLSGYLLAGPWPLGSIPPLNTLLTSLLGASDALFVHDLALDRRAKGTGQAGAIIDRLVQQAYATEFRHLALVAVNGTATFWGHHGFGSASGSPELAAKLASYGAGAQYMRRDLARPPV